jgi:hypothetical protein
MVKRADESAKYVLPDYVVSGSRGSFTVSHRL